MVLERRVTARLSSGPKSSSVRIRIQLIHAMRFAQIGLKLLRCCVIQVSRSVVRRSRDDAIIQLYVVGSKDAYILNPSA